MNSYISCSVHDWEMLEGEGVEHWPWTYFPLCVLPLEPQRLA